MSKEPIDSHITDMTHSIILCFYKGMPSLIQEKLHSDIVWINNLTHQCLYGYYCVSSGLFKTCRQTQCHIVFTHTHLLSLSPETFIVSCEYTVCGKDNNSRQYCSSFIWKAGPENMKLIYVHMSPSSPPPAAEQILSIYGRHSEVYRVHPEDILYIEADDIYSRICCRSIHMTACQSISHLEKLLPPYFMRIHRSFIVNKQYVSRSFRYGLELSDGTQLPIPEKRYMKVLCWLET